MSAIGFAITKITSRFGLLSRKASERLAAETGIKLCNKTNQLGRSINKTEIEEVVASTIPKRCRPKIMTKTADLEAMFKNQDMPLASEVAKYYADNAKAMCFPNGKGKMDIFIQLESFSKNNIPSSLAHEMEHALEFGSTLKDKFMRKVFIPLYTKVIEKKYHYIPDAQKLAEKQVDLESAIHYIAEQPLESLNKKDYKELLREVIRTVVDPSSSQTSVLHYDWLRLKLGQEIPAYRAGGVVERYASSLEKEIPEQRTLALLYNDVRDILKEEKRIYLKNKKNGNIIQQNDELISYSSFDAHRGYKTYKGNDIISVDEGSLQNKSSDFLKNNPFGGHNS